ncbi:MAG: hypothetical protein AB7U95_36415 [Reyranella sp.]
MKKGIIAGLVLLGLIGICLAAVPLIQIHVADLLKAEIERSGTTKVGSVEVALFDRQIVLLDVKTTRPAGEMTIGRVDASGLDWPIRELLQGRTPLQGIRWGDPLQVKRLEVKDFRAVDQITEVSLASMVVDDFDLDRFDPGEPGPHAERQRVARALAALEVGRLELHTLSIAQQQKGDTFGLASFFVERFDRGRIARLTVSDMEATAKGKKVAEVKVGDFDVSGLDVTRLLGALGSSEWEPGMPMGRANLASGRISGFGGDAFSRYGISLGSISVETVQESKDVSRTRTRIEGFVLAPPLRGLEALQLRIALQSMGLKEIKLDLDCSGLEDRAKGVLAVEQCTLVGPGLGEIDFSAQLVNADAAFWQAIDEGDLDGLQMTSAALGSAKLVVADKSLLERSLKALSTVTGQPIAKTRANLANEIRRYSPPGVLISERMTKLFDTIAQFIERGGTLTIDARPDPPVDLDRFTYLIRPDADLVSGLGLTATLSK